MTLGGFQMGKMRHWWKWDSAPQASAKVGAEMQLSQLLPLHSLLRLRSSQAQWRRLLLPEVEPHWNNWRTNYEQPWTPALLARSRNGPFSKPAGLVKIRWDWHHSLKTLPASHRQKTLQGSIVFLLFAAPQAACRARGLSSGISESGTKRSCSFWPNPAVQHINLLSPAPFQGCQPGPAAGTPPKCSGQQAGAKQGQTWLINRNIRNDGGHWWNTSNGANVRSFTNPHPTWPLLEKKLSHAQPTAYWLKNAQPSN